MAKENREWQFEPCPFCRMDNIELFEIIAKKANYPAGSFSHTDDFVVMCQSCGARGPKEQTEAGAVQTWNAAPRKETT
jgi:hypothetical protein